MAGTRKRTAGQAADRPDGPAGCAMIGVASGAASWPWSQRAVTAFGADRVVFGTDFPHVRNSCSYAEAIRWIGELPFLDDAGREAVSDANVRRLWGLGHR